MTLCPECKWKYPVAILNKLFIMGGHTEPICGICALEAVNKVSGVTRTEFQGKMAEHCRQDAILWRKRHPEHKPQES